MADSRYIVTHSNYTIKEKHQTTKNGQIFVRDYMTTTSPSSWEGDVFPYGESNFKIVRRGDSNSQKKHKYGEWLTQDSCIDGNNNGEFWTKDCLSTSVTETIVTENEIKIKPDYSTLLDFCCFGSCTTLIEGSINNIIKNYPAELYITNESYNYIAQIPTINANGKKEISTDRIVIGENNADDIENIKENFIVKDYEVTPIENPVYIENPFEIDVVSLSIPTKDENPNELRYFCQSSKKYEILNDKNILVGCVNGWSVIYRTKPCKEGQLIGIIQLSSCFNPVNDEDDNKFVIFEYIANGKKVLVCDSKYSGFKIRPTKHYIGQFRNSLSLFEDYMLNDYTNPLYQMTLDVPRETNTGYVITKEKFTWPTDYNWNLDISSNIFEEYVNSLMSLGEFYDDGYSNNLYNVMTHESIKAMDTTITKGDTVFTNDDFVEGENRIESIIKLFGLMLDELKISTKNIKTINNVTYNEHSNIPDYFLTDSIEECGLEPFCPTKTLDTNTSVANLYETVSKAYDAKAANVEFLKRLQINANAILRRKGTRHSIEMILGLFGMESYDFARHRVEGFDSLSEIDKMKNYDYTINEYVYNVVSATSMCSAGEELPIEKYNTLKKSYDEREVTDTLEGLPCAMVYFEKDGETYKYLIPWFSKNKSLDGKPYFQMYGGWGRMYSKKIQDKQSDLTHIIGTSDYKLYDETLKYLRVVKNIEALFTIETELNKNDVIYVNDIANIGDYDFDYKTASNYFILTDDNNKRKIDGWNNIPETDIANGKNDGIRVLYLENIIEDYKGNNPHIGYGKYDEGEEYLNYLRQLFYYSINNDNFMPEAYDCATDKLYSEILNEGFKIELRKDNQKCWYYSDEKNGLYSIVNEAIYSENTFTQLTDYTGNTQVVFENLVPYSNGTPNKENAFFESDSIPYDFENDTINEYNESSANSIINCKKLEIVFNNRPDDVDGVTNKIKRAGFAKTTEEFRNYLFECVMPYVKQVIPSTTILSVSILGEEATFVEDNYAVIVGVTESTENLASKYNK